MKVLVPGSPRDHLGNLVAHTLVGSLMLLGSWEHLLHILSHGLLVVTVAVSSGGVVLYNINTSVT